MNTDTEKLDDWRSREPAMQEVLNTARIVAATGADTLILGEVGAGKTRLARAIHEQTPRQGLPFVTVACAVLPAAQAESLLFGHGGARSAAEGPDGFLQAAAAGTLFLDGVEQLPLPVQARLLHFLESGEVVATDGSRTRPTHLRVIAASAQDLAQAVAAGTFDPALYYRLHGVSLMLPPLRERRRDIAELAELFLAGYAATHRIAAASLDERAARRLAEQPWPGNVYELKGLCKRLALLLPGRTLGLANLPPAYRRPPARSERLFALPSQGIDLAELEKDLIAQALERTGGNHSRAARLLGLSRDTLLYRLKKFAMR